MIVPGPNRSPSGVPTPLAISVDRVGTLAGFHVNGILTTSNSPVRPRGVDLGGTSRNYIGRSHCVAEPYFSGTIADLRIYD